MTKNINITADSATLRGLINTNFFKEFHPPEKQSIREAIVHLFAKYLEMRPLFFAAARPMKVEWKMRPYLGVFPRVFSALIKISVFLFINENKSVSLKTECGGVCVGVINI